MRGKSPRISTPSASFSEEFGNALEYGWGPILVSLLFSVALAVPDPSHEALMSLAENAIRSLQGAVAGAVTLLAFFFLPPTLHLFTRYALKTPRYYGDHREQVEAVILTWVGRLPLIAVVIAGFRVQFGEDSVSLGARVVLGLFMALCGIFALTGTWVFFAREKRERIKAKCPGLSRLYARIRDLGTDHQAWAALGFGALLLVATVWPKYAVWTGPITVAVVFVMLAAMALALLTRLSSRLCKGQIPLALFVLGLVIAGTGRTGALIFLGLVAVYALAVFWRPGNSSGPEKWTAGAFLAASVALALWGEVRRGDCRALSGCYLVSAETVAPTDTLTGFRAWQQDRPRGAPIRLIAAEGGGIFSAYYTALYLAKRADGEGSGFTGSIFAISGVSGGSVGAAAFWAVVKSGACKDAAPETACHQRLAREILAQDYLSPVLARMFTADLVDRLLPYSSIFPDSRQDRARELELALSRNAEASFAAARASAAPAAPAEAQAVLATPLAASWSPASGMPALFLNGTRVWDGARLVMSPFAALRPLAVENLQKKAAEPCPDPAGRAEPEYLMDGAGLPVTTAAFISARFPLVTAAARLQTRCGVRQVVDGGYFDNSGMETMQDILEVIAQDAQGPVFAQTLTTRGRGALEDSKQDIRGSLGTPVGAFVGAWRSRLSLVWNRMSDRWKAAASDATKGYAASFRVETPVFRLPLRALNYTTTWYLDHTSFCRIEQNLNAEILRQKPPFAAEVLTSPEGCPDLPEALPDAFAKLSLLGR